MHGERGKRVAAWAVLALLAVAVARQGLGRDGRLADLRDREAALSRRLDGLSRALAADPRAADCRRDRRPPPSVPEAGRALDELWRVRRQIADLQSFGW